MHNDNQNTVKDKQTINVSKSSIFADTFGLSNIYRRLERLSVATYSITDFFVSDEPLKYSLRQTIGQLLKDTTSLVSVDNSNKTLLVKRVSAGLVELSTYYELSYNAKIISAMNFEIVYAEIAKVVTLFGDLENALTQPSNTPNTIELSSDFFDLSEEEEQENLENLFEQSNSTAEKYFDDKKDIEKDSDFNNEDIKDINIIKNANLSHSSNNDNDKGQNLAKDKRQQKILELLASGEQFSIQDIFTHFSDISSKTIQRDLTELLAQSKIIKQGERRWSTYSLN